MAKDEWLRVAWRVTLTREFATERLVFVDEMGTNTSLHPLYAWSPKGERARCSVPRNRGPNTTLAAGEHDHRGYGSVSSSARCDDDQDCLRDLHRESSPPEPWTRASGGGDGQPPLGPQGRADQRELLESAGAASYYSICQRTTHRTTSAPSKRPSQRSKAFLFARRRLGAGKRWWRL
jgi:hypothetical protein